MEVLRVRGVPGVAKLLRRLADQIERGAVSVDGQPVDVSGSLEAVLSLASEGQDVSLVAVRFEHKTPAVWDLKELQQAMAHPGD